MLLRRFVLTLPILIVTAWPVAALTQNAAVGAWEITTQSPEGTFVSQLEVREESGKLVAVGKSAQGERPYDGVTVDGSAIVLVITISYNGSPMTITYRGEIKGGSMAGDADFGGLATGTWSAERK